MAENRQIARAAGLIGALTLCSRITGLARDVAIGYFFGTGMAADSFFVAFRIPNLFRRLVAEGAMNVAFIPVFTDYLTNRSRSEAVRVLQVLLAGATVVLACLTVAGTILAPLWVSLFAPGFTGNTGQMQLIVGLTRLLFPYILLIGLVALFGGFLNALRHFTSPALSPLLLNLSMIAAVIFLSPQLSTPILGLAYGVLLGGVLQLILQVVPLWLGGIRLLPVWSLRHPAVGRVLLLLAPTLFGAAVYQVNIIMSTVFASLLPPGSVSYLWYADRVFEFPLGVFAVALGTAALPSFAAQAARGAYGELRTSLVFAIALTNFVALPAACGLVVLARPITAVLFQRGAFGAVEVEMTARALQALALGLWSVSLVRVLAPAFYAINDARTPVLAAAAAFLANVAFSLMLMGPVGGDGPSGVVSGIAWGTRALGVWNLRHVGLALATALAATVNVVLLGIALWRRLGGLEVRGPVTSLGRSVAAVLPMIPVVHLIASLIDWHVQGQWGLKVGLLAVAIGAGTLVFSLTAYAIGGPEVEAVRRLLAGQAGRRQGGA